MANITGTAANNTLTGTNASDTITGLGGNDTLNGGGGIDRVDGGVGNDTLNGGTGIDLLIGGAGNDTYVIDNVAEINKATADAGIDTVQSSITYTLGAQQENLTLLGNGNLNGTGNAGSNVLTGNGGGNVLNGMSGNDTLTGGGGNDRLSGGGGNDSLRFDSTDTRGVDGGADTDTLLVTGAMAVDLVVLNDSPRFTNFEVINLGAGNQTLMLDEDTVLGLSSSTNTVQIKGGAGDEIQADGFWSELPDVTIGGTLYHRLKSGAAVIQVQDGIDTSPISKLTKVFELSSLNGANGFQINGEAAGNNGGSFVSIAGDLNGDGFADLLIGAPFADAPADQSGAMYVVFGTESGFSANFELSTLNGSNGFKINGVAQDETFGRLGAGGDVNGDGIDDLVFGNQYLNANELTDAGALFVMYGHTTSFNAAYELSAFNGPVGFQMYGENALDYLGGDISVGDLNADGFADVISGTRGTVAESGLKTEINVLYGTSAEFSSALEMSFLTGSSGFTIFTEAFYGNATGWDSPGTALDVNADGYDDLLIGVGLGDTAPLDTFGNNAGVAYAVFGNSTGFPVDDYLTTLNGANGFQMNGISTREYAGGEIEAGDINGDGIADMVLTAHKADSNDEINSGAVFVVFGKGSGQPSTDFELSSLNGTNGFRINGTDASDYAGSAIASAGDVNGDGFDDLLINSFWGRANGSFSGQTYLIFGKSTGFPAVFQLSTLNGFNGFQINGEAASDFSGQSLSMAGDVNGDGFDDLMVSARSADPNGKIDAGSSYIIFGRDFRNETSFVGTGVDDSFTGVNNADIAVGGAGNDAIAGAGGQDVLTGGAGDDTLSGDGGYDLLRGGTGDDTLSGGAGNDRLEGDEGADILDGGTGNDSLRGGIGDDRFRFDDLLGASNVDTIMDFGGAGAVEMDVIQLDREVFTVFTSTGALDESAFESGASLEAADTTAGRIVYNTTTGALYYDVDGEGGAVAVQFGVIASDVDELDAADFTVI